MGSAALGAPGPLEQQGDLWWLGLASRPGLDEAIGVAETFDVQPLMVAKSANGWFAAAAGPFHVPQGKAHVTLQKLKEQYALPGDVYLTRGANYGDVAWTPPASNIEATLKYDGDRDVTLQSGAFRFEVKRKLRDKDEYDPVLTAFYEGKEAVHLEIDSPAEKPSLTIRLVRLNPNSSLPAIVVTRYLGGAHCCTLTRIASRASDASWSTVDIGPMDGDGFDFRDLEGRGFSYLVSSDQSFLYTFAPYAMSFPPIRIQRLEGTRLIDVTRDPSMRRFIVQDIYREKRFAQQQNELTGHGYLAGFVAESLLAGDGEAAWNLMLSQYDRASTPFGIDKCTVADVPADKCPDDRKVQLPYPEGLRLFLTDHGYITNPKLYPVVSNASQAR